MKNLEPGLLLGFLWDACSPGGGDDGSVETPVAGESHSYGYGPAHHAQRVVGKRLRGDVVFTFTYRHC